ncbi:MAG: queuosine precursor transporter [Candidatus Babeliaceae bacterium]|jgi:hypothetical protein
MINELLFFLYLGTVAIFLAIISFFGVSALTAYMSILAIFSNIFVLKQITLFGFNATASDALAVGGTITLNIIQQRYMANSAQKAIIVSFLCLLFYTIITSLHNMYIPTTTDWSAFHYQAIFSPAWRITTASLFVYYCSQQIDYFIYQSLTKRYNHLSPVKKSFVSLSISQLIDTALFTILGLYGLIDHIVYVIAISYFIKVLTFTSTLCILPFLMHYIESKHDVF